MIATEFESEFLDAVACAVLFGSAWEAAPGAVDWLKRTGPCVSLPMPRAARRVERVRVGQRD